MASVLKVDKLDPQSGTALEIGSSGDTITIPSGATFTQSGTMNASAITAGTVATARLGSGTASSSTFLRGDQTYAAPGGVALTGSTDNTVVTVTGADAIQGEATMTYDGTTLALTTSGGGLKLNDLDSSDVNTLDDYEEGSFTSTLIGTTGTAGAWAMTGGVSKYVKVGKMVHIQGSGYLTNVGSYTGTAKIGGLPFTNNDTPGSIAVSAFPTNLDTSAAGYPKGMGYNVAYQATGMNIKCAAAWDTSMTYANVVTYKYWNFGGSYMIN